MEYTWDSNLVEWYVSEPGGLEHGFTLQSRPETSERPGSLEFELEVLGGLRGEAIRGGRGIRFVDGQGATALLYSGLHVFDANGVDHEAQLSMRGDAVVISVQEASAAYPLTIDPVAQEALLKAPNADADDRFGWSVAVSGDTVVVGAPFEDSGAAGINGNQMDDSKPDSGAVYVFAKVGGVWTLQAYLKAFNSAASDWFGSTLALDGDTLVVGAAYEDSDALGAFMDTQAAWQFAMVRLT